MEGRSVNGEVYPQLLDLISKEREWLMNRDGSRNLMSAEEGKLELRLGPLGEDWTSKDHMREREESLLSLGYFSVNLKGQHSTIGTFNSGSEKAAAAAALSSPWCFQQGMSQHNQQLQLPSKSQSFPVMVKEVSQGCSPKLVDLNNREKKAFLPSSEDTAVPNSSQKRTAPGPVVGWPPIRSFRKNLASNKCSKPSSDTQHQDVVSDKASCKKPVDTSFSKGMFVKINMDGVPIGRKIDLHAYGSYEQLSSAVDELFRGLLAAQRDSCAGGIQNNEEEEKAITGLLDGSGEYTLVYEDNEGDRMLVGDVPWHMFVSTVKRLRVLQSSELPSLSFGCKQERNTSATAMK